MKRVVVLSLLAASWAVAGFCQGVERPRLAVELSSTPVTAMLRISGDGAVVAATRRLADPERLEVELQGVVHNTAGGRDVDGPVSRMRVEQRRLGAEPVSVVTVDLRRPVELSVEQRPSSIVVTFVPPRNVEPEPLESTRVPAPRGTLFLGLELSDLSTGSGGDRGAVDWVRPTRLGPTWFLGLATSRLAGTEWNVGRAGAVAGIGKTTLAGEVQLGGGRTGEHSFDYRVIEAAVTRTVVDRRFYLRLKNRYLDIDTTRGNLLEAGFTYLPGRRWSTQLAYARATGGNFETDYVSGRFDVAAHPRLRLLGGFTLGHTRPEIFNVIGEAAVDLEEVFFGVTVPVRRTELTVVVDRLELGDVERGTLSLSLRVPWGNGNQERREP